MKTILLLSISILIFATTKLFAQTSVIDSIGHPTYLKVFLDGVPDWQDYIKVKMWYADFVRDPKFAQVQVIVSSLSTASGGKIYYLFFEGRDNFLGRNDTITYTAAEENTNKQTRDDLTNSMLMGLMPYFAMNGQQKYFSFDYSDVQQKMQKSFDKWNYWVFTVEANPDLSKDESGSAIAGDALVSAARVTDDWKFRLTGDLVVDYNKFITDSLKYTSTELIKLANTLLVKSVNDHWSLGLEGGYYSSTFNNIAHQFSVAGGIEYDVFPYTQSVNHLLTFRYRLQPQYDFYGDTTIYNSLNEFLINHIFDATYTRVEKWGDITLALTGKEFVNHPAQFRIDVAGQMDFHIIQGLFVSILGNYSYIKNQRDISNVGLTAEEIVLQHKELLTNYSYGLQVGLSYTFGAIYNNIVNPRYESGILIDPEIANILSVNLLGKKD